MHGLGNRIKRKAIFQYLKDQQLDIVLLQETHSEKRILKIWESEWGRKWYASHKSTCSGGTAILINPKCKNITVNSVAYSNSGHYTICTVQIDNKKYSICNAYAPNNDSPEFFQKLMKDMDKYSEENIIIGGDFNLTLDCTKDRLNSTSNNNKSGRILEICNGRK